jgi:hypothetical protein
VTRGEAGLADGTGGAECAAAHLCVRRAKRRSRARSGVMASGVNAAVAQGAKAFLHKRVWPKSS